MSQVRKPVSGGVLLCTVAHSASVMCREALHRSACTNGVFYARKTITVCAHTLSGMNRRWHGANLPAELRQPCTLVGWLLGRLKFAAWHFCGGRWLMQYGGMWRSANLRSASLLVLRMRLPQMLDEGFIALFGEL